MGLFNMPSFDFWYLKLDLKATFSHTMLMHMDFNHTKALVSYK